MVSIWHEQHRDTSASQGGGAAALDPPYAWRRTRAGWPRSASERRQRMDDEFTRRLHPAVRQRREDMIQYWSGSLDEPLTPGYHPLMAAESDLRNAVEAAVVGLEDIARRFLIRARATLKEVFGSGVQPYIGGPPVGCPEDNDDTDLDRHWAIAYKARYLIGLLLDRGDDADLHEAVQRMGLLVAKTNGLSGPIRMARFDIIAEFLWLAVAARDCDAALRAASPHLTRKVTPKTRILSYRQQIAYVRAFFAVASYAHGDNAFGPAARESLRNLLEAHRDFDGEAQEIVWQGSWFAFDVAWLWECAFRRPQDATHAIEIVRGTASLED